MYTCRNQDIAKQGVVGNVEYHTYTYTPEEQENGGMFHRKPIPELAGDYDSSPMLNHSKYPDPYENPTNLTGPIPIRSMPDFFATLDQSMTPSYGSKPVAGAVYVLTGGRGIILSDRHLDSRWELHGRLRTEPTGKNLQIAIHVLSWWLACSSGVLYEMWDLGPASWAASVAQLVERSV